MITLKYILLVILVTPISILINLSVWSSYTMDFLLSLVEDPHPTYNFIVVGAGSAGSVVAGRLAEAGQSVLLIEAGGASPNLIHIPAFCASGQMSGVDWQYKTTQQKGATLNTGGVSNWPRGRVLGGSSMLNYMIYMRGHRDDYNEWKEYGVKGWDYKDVLPYFKKSEGYVGELETEDVEYHGRDGPLKVSPKSFSDPVVDVFLKAGQQMGYKLGDMNGDGQNGSFSYTPASLNNGERTGTFRAFAEKQVGQNLRVLTQAHVTKLILEKDKVKGVQVRRFGKEEIIYTSGEVILSAGSIGTPQILMLSGIGDRTELENLGIRTVLHSPQVGKNLQDHLMASYPFHSPSHLNLDVFAGAKPKNVLDYMSGVGPLTSLGGCGGNAFIHTSVNKEKRPDIQLHFISFTIHSDEGVLLRHVMGTQDQHYDWFARQTPGATIVPTLNRPKSRGYVKLSSKDPLQYPIIEPNYLTEEEDVEALAAGLEFAREMLRTPAFKEINATPYDPFPPCSDKFEFESRDYFKCFARYWTSTIYHPVGTAAMGTVLDSRLRLKGMKNLRVADGSVMPKIVGGNTNAPIIMIGERAADFIIQDWNIRSTAKVHKEAAARTEL